MSRQLEGKKVFRLSFVYFFLAHLLLYILGFISFVSPVFNFLGGGSFARGTTYSFLFLVPFLAFFLIIRKEFSSFFSIVLLWVILCFAFSLFVSLISNSYEAIEETLGASLSLMAAYSYVLILSKFFREDPSKVLFSVFYHLSVFWGIVLILSFLFPVFKEFMSLIFYRDYTSGVHLVELRIPGFHPTGGDGASMNMMLLVLASTGYLRYLFGLRKAIAIFLLSVTALSSLLSARSGFFIGMPLFILLVLLFWDAPAQVKSVFLFLFTAVSLVIFRYFYIFSINNYDSIAGVLGHEHPYLRIMRVFANLETEGSQGVLGTIFGKMMAFPSDLKDMLIGTGTFSRHIPSVYIPGGTDVGYIRVLNGIGMLGSGLFYFIYFIPVILIFLKKRIVKYSVLFYVLFLYIFVGHIKIQFVNTITASLIYFSVFFTLAISFSPTQKSDSRPLFLPKLRETGGNTNKGGAP